MAVAPTIIVSGRTKTSPAAQMKIVRYLSQLLLRSRVHGYFIHADHVAFWGRPCVISAAPPPDVLGSLADRLEPMAAVARHPLS